MPKFPALVLMATVALLLAACARKDATQVGAVNRSRLDGFIEAQLPERAAAVAS